MKKNANNIKRKIYWVCSIVGVAILLLTQLNFQDTKSSNIESGIINNTKLTSDKFSLNSQLRFIMNNGQINTDAKFHVQGVGHTVLFHPDKIVLKRDEAEFAKNEIVLQFVDANQTPIIAGTDKLAGVAHFYKGQNPDHWQTNVPTYKSVLYSQLYPGIDMGYIGKNGKLESEFYLSPGIDYHQIKLDYQGIISKSIRDDGALVLQTELGELIEKTPYAYQDINGVRNKIEAEYVLLADASIGFELENYNHNFPLVIDPELIFITTVPSGVGNGAGAGVVVSDTDGNLILAGVTDRFFPAADVIAGSNHVGGLSNDGLIVKLDSVGNVIYSALFGGSRLDYFTDMVIDSLDNIYLTGLTSSTDFPRMNAMQDSSGGGDDAFLVIINSAGVVTYSSYIGGSTGDWGAEIAIDNSGNIYIGGTTTSIDFPVLGAYQSTYQGGEVDVFLTKFNPSGSIIYSTYFGGSSADRLRGLEVDDSNQVTLVGSTVSIDFPIMNAYQDTLGGVKSSQGDIFISRLNSIGSGLIYSTYLGGAVQEWATGLALTSNGHAFITGGTRSLNFPIVNGVSSPEADSSDGVFISLDNNGQPNYSLRTNIPGSENFIEVAIGYSIFPIAIGHWNDSVRIFLSKGDSVLYEASKYAVSEHSVNGANFHRNKLAIATTYFTPILNNSKQTPINNLASISLSSSEVGCVLITPISTAIAVLHYENLAFFANGYDFGDGVFKMHAEPDGKVKINDAKTNINANEVTEIDLEATFDDDIIDLELMIPEDFTVLNNVAIITNDGSDELYLHIFALVNYQLNLGAGADQIYIALLANALTVLLNGGIGGDTYNFTREMPSGGTFQKSYTRNISQANAAAPITFIDSSGYDTLNFSGYDIGITLDVTLQKVSQFLDTSGMQIMLDGEFEVVIGTNFDDEVTFSPLVDSIRHFDGGTGNDTLNFVSPNGQSVDDGSMITTPGYADVTYANVETVNLSVATDIDDPITNLPNQFSLIQNYPNPFNPTTTIEFNLPIKSNVIINIYNLLGQEVQQLVNQEYSAGNYKVTWDGTSTDGIQVSTGMYLYRITTDNFIETKKMLLLK